MRFQRLHLQRFGRFTDVTVDFPKSQHDLHVIYGPNEAGKSTTLAAIEGLLFGIPTRSPHNFLHENSALRIGAVLEHDGQQFEVVRRKGVRDTLLDKDGVPLRTGDPLAHLRGGVDDGFFRQLFSLDHDRLKQGGREILESENEVGQMLFSASTGLLGLRGKLATLIEEAEGLWAPRYSAKRKYHAAADRLAEADKQQREHLLLADKWQAARKALQEAEAECDSIGQRNEARVAEQRRLSRIRRVYRTVQTLATLGQELEQLGPVVPFPNDVEANFARETGNETTAQAKIAEINRQLEASREARAALVCDEAVRNGVKASSLATIEDLLVPTVIQRGFEFFLARSSGKITSQILGIANVLVALAKLSGELAPKALDAALVTLDKVRRDPDGRWRFKQVGMAGRNKALLRQFTDPTNVAKIIYATDILCEGLPPKGPLTVRQAERVRAALMIELELVFPVREKNLAELRLDTQIQWSQAGRQGAVSIYIEAVDVKNDQELEVQQLPERTARLLNYYLGYARPVLGGSTDLWLFPGKSGHLHSRSMGEQLKKVIKRKLGLALNLHAFRHLCAKLYLDRNPGQYVIIQHALGHKHVETTIKFYAEISSVLALKLVDENLLNLRAEYAHLVPGRQRRRRK